MADKPPFRDLTSFEHELTLHLLDAPVRGRRDQVDALRDALAKQVPNSRARTLDEGPDCFLIEWELPSGWPQGHYPVVEGEAEDADGVPIWVLLFEASGRLWGLDLVKGDGSPIVRMPEVAQFRAWVSGDLDSAIPPWPIGKRPVDRH